MDPQVNYYNISLRYLSFRSRSVYEVQSYLKKKGASTSEIERVITKLTEKKFLNDLEFAKDIYRSKTKYKNRSKLQITMDLKKLGVDSEVIEDSFNNSEDFNEIKQAKNLLIKKYNDLSVLKSNEAKQKALAFLSRKGFSYNICKNAIDELIYENV